MTKTTSKQPGPTTSRRRIRPRYDDDGKLLSTDIETEAPPIPEPTEQEKKISAVIEKSFEMGDDAAKSISRFEKNTLLQRYRENELSEEEFNVEAFNNLCGELANLQMVKNLLPLFELERYESDILVHFINKAFGAPRTTPGGEDTPRVFRGDDEAALAFQALNDGPVGLVKK